MVVSKAMCGQFLTSQTVCTDACEHSRTEEDNWQLSLQLEGVVARVGVSILTVACIFVFSTSAAEGLNRF